MRIVRADHAGMANKPQQRFNRLYIGEWLTKLGRRPSELSKASGVDEGYLSQLISGEKNNPSAAQLMAISTELGISVNALYSRPPVVDVTDRVRTLRPDQVEALGALLDEFQGRKPPK